jgi:diguanylate cyclase (GGDEF)-like protein
LTIAGLLVTAVGILGVILYLRRPRAGLIALGIALYYVALTLIVLGDRAENTGILALTAVPVVASALYGPRRLTGLALLAATATLVCVGLVNRLAINDFVQLLAVWPSTGLGMAYTIHHLRSRLERTVADREQMIQQDATLSLVTDDLYSTGDSDEVLHVALQSAARLTALPGEPTPSALFFLFEGDHATLVASYLPDAPAGDQADPLLEGVSFPLSATASLQASMARSDDRLFILDRSTSVSPEVETALVALNVDNAIAHLVRVDHRAIGFLAVVNSNRPTSYTEAQGQWLRKLAGILELALSRAFLYESRVSTDALTGLSNRREFERRLSSMSQGTPYALVSIDVDKLKRMNDTFGHRAGDELLRAVAAALQRSVRRGDVAARVGGDEFALILQETEDERVARIADRILVELAKVTVHDQTPSVSIGIAGFGSGADAAARMTAADNAMYGAKRSGGHRAAFAPAAQLQVTTVPPTVTRRRFDAVSG